MMSRRYISSFWPESDGSTLTLDFTTGVLDSRLSFTRGSTGTRINSSGFVETMSNNVARFDHDPTTLAPRGLLIEGQVANIVTYSGDLTQNGAGHWTGRTNLVTTNWTGFTAPDNTASAVKIIPDTTSGRHTIENNAPSIVNGTTYTASAFVKADGYTVASLVVAGGQARRNFTLTGAGSPGSQFGATNTATIVPVGTQGWYRVTMTWTSTLTGGAAFWIGVPQNATTDAVSSWSGNGTSAIQAWGAMLEQGSGASSYIPTGASTAQRNADSCIMEGTNFSTWWANPASWSMLLDFTPTGVVPGQTPDALRLINRPSPINSTWFYLYGATTMTLVSRIGNGTAVENNAATGQTYGNRAKVMHAIAPGVHTLSFNGSTVAAANTIASMPTGINALGIMNNGLSGAGAVGHAAVRSVKFWPTALPQATLNSITTL
jgi:hypothetical protein